MLFKITIKFLYLYQHTVFQSGCGFFPLQKLERVQVAFLSIDNLFDGSSRIIRIGARAL